MTEDTFLHRMFQRLAPPARSVVIPPGDDCAGIDIGGGRLLLATVDQIVGGRHYTDSPPDATPPRTVGRKLLARNLSDVAAMGGTPLFALVATTLPPNRDHAWLDAFLDGVRELAEAHGVDIVGGDLARACHDHVGSVTLLGDVPADEVCRRDGAQPGDCLCVTGRFGRSFETGHHLSFEPRCAEGRWLAHSGHVHAMIDISDGLWLDCLRMCRASGVALRLDPDGVPRRTPDTTPAQALSDGEDYELAVALAPDAAADLAAAWPFRAVPFTRVGEFTAAADPEITDPNGQPLPPASCGGYDHLTE